LFNERLRRCFAAVAVATWTSACMPAEPELDSSYASSVGAELSALLDSAEAESCELALTWQDSPLGPQKLARPALFAGVRGSAGLALSPGGGAELVVDLWTHEASVFVYGGVVASVRGLGADAGAYAGLGFGVEGVRSWNGTFVGASASLDLLAPFRLLLPLPFSLGPEVSAFFSSAEIPTLPADLVEVSQELLDRFTPDHRIYGISSGMTVGVEVLPLPGSLAVSAQEWRESTAANQFLVDLHRFPMALDDGILSFAPEPHLLASWPVHYQIADRFLESWGIGIETRAGIWQAFAFELIAGPALKLSPGVGKLSRAAYLVGILFGRYQDAAGSRSRPEDLLESIAPHCFAPGAN